MGYFEDLVSTSKVKTVKGKGSGWVNYKWPKPGEEKLSDKTTYVLKVDENFYVTAGYFK